MSTAFRTIEFSDPRFEPAGLRFITVGSPALRGRGDICLALPQAPAKDLPLVILLHGVYGSHWAWALKGGAHTTLARLANELPPMALAMPSDGLWGDGSGYVAHHDGADYERWIVDEVPAAAALADARITTQSPLFIAGLSMGGFGTLRLAAKFPERFRAASAHSSATASENLAQFIQCGSSLDVFRDRRSVLQTILEHRATMPPFRFDCGTEDFLLPHNRELHTALEAAGVPHVYEEFPGGHDWPYWEAHLEDSLRFFAAQLARG